MSAVYDKKKKCPVCLREFWASRRDAVCCSPRCKKRMQRTPSKEEYLKEGFSDAQSSMRLLSMYIDDPIHKARAINSLRALIREFAGSLPGYMRHALGNELLESVSAGELLDYQSQAGH